MLCAVVTSRRLVYVSTYLEVVSRLGILNRRERLEAAKQERREVATPVTKELLRGEGDRYCKGLTATCERWAFCVK